jgi:CDP-diacylglycerol--serine O-phosphatidyltransferase
MVSNIRYYGFKEFGLFRRIPFIFLVVLVILLTIIAYKPELMLLISTVLYIASGPVRWFVFAVMKKHENVNPLDQSVIIEDKKSQL